ncbi:MAG: cbb3-type cytochrome c oxidase N-terminal domain-containing protein [Thermodesulfovibrionales bacterium]
MEQAKKTTEDLYRAEASAAGAGASGEEDSMAGMERDDTRTRLPLGWLLLFIGLIVWGIWYGIAYTPALSGWSQEGQYRESLKK